jgi:hypothetical protein
MTSLRIAVVALTSLLSAALYAGPALAAAGEDLLHEVRTGDNLHLIAGYYYGDARQWERIWEANREQLGNPNRLERGAWLRVPDASVPAETYGDFLARMGTIEAAALAAVAPPQGPPVEPAAAPSPPAAVPVSAATASPGPPSQQ